MKPVVDVLYRNSTEAAGTDVEVETFIRVKAPAAGKRTTVRRMLVADCSGSMHHPHGTVTKIEALQDAILSMLQDTQSGDVIGLVAFEADRAWEVSANLVGLSNTEDLVRSLAPGGCTPMWAGLELANQVDSEADLILFSDGAANAGMYIGQDLVREAKALGVRIHTIGVGQFADMKMLEDIARETGGSFSVSLSATDMENACASAFCTSEERYSYRVEVKAGKGVKLRGPENDPDWHVSSRTARTALKDLWPGQVRLLRLEWVVAQPNIGKCQLGNVIVDGNCLTVAMTFAEKAKERINHRWAFQSYDLAMKFTAGAQWNSSSACGLGTAAHAPMAPAVAA